jgi:DNA polymerase
MLVGEQPGDEEDLRGRAFVGPAGRLLDELLEAAGIERASVYITNAVKHFKWEPRGKRRLHKRPNATEISACNVWLQREIDSGKPSVILCLGATATRAVLGREMPVASSRGRSFPREGGAVVRVTYHPSAILRAMVAGDAGPMRAAVVKDLRAAWRLAAKDSED